MLHSNTSVWGTIHDLTWSVVLQSDRKALLCLAIVSRYIRLSRSGNSKRPPGFVIRDELALEIKYILQAVCVTNNTYIYNIDLPHIMKTNARIHSF